MGLEYQLKFATCHAEPCLDTLLRGVVGFAGVEPTFGSYQYRSEDNVGKMPNLEVCIEPGGLAVCDYGDGQRFLSAIVMECVAQLDEVTVSKRDW